MTHSPWGRASEYAADRTTDDALPVVLPRLARTRRPCAGPGGPLDLGRPGGVLRSVRPEPGRWLAICREALQDGDPYIAYCLEILADLYQESGRYEEAEPLYRQSIDLNEKAFHPGHPWVLKLVLTLASLPRLTGREAEARALESRGGGPNRT